MTQPTPAPATSFVERFRTEAGRRSLGFALALLVEALLVLMMLTLGPGVLPEAEEKRPTVITFVPSEVPEEPKEASSAEAQRRSDEPPAEQRPEPDELRPPAEPPPAIPRTTIMPTPWQLPPAPRPAYGPADRRSAASRDSERVGTAPNGEPLYAAEWYREPDEVAMRSYLSTARGPGWGLIACRTVPNYRVEDCVALSEYPEGSQINRSALAAAWEFRVRPPRLGGRPLVGSWVRIRIEYDIVRH